MIVARLTRWIGFALLAIAILLIGVWCSVAIRYRRRRTSARPFGRGRFGLRHRHGGVPCETQAMVWWRMLLLSSSFLPEDVRIYHLRMTPENTQVLLREYAQDVNDLAGCRVSTTR
jgi:hypothetical protein